MGNWHSDHQTDPTSNNPRCNATLHWRQAILVPLDKWPKPALSEIGSSNILQCAKAKRKSWFHLNECAQVFCATFSWTRAHPMKAKSDKHKGSSQMFHDVGVPMAIVVDLPRKKCMASSSTRHPNMELLSSQLSPILHGNKLRKMSSRKQRTLLCKNKPRQNCHTPYGTILLSWKHSSDNTRLMDIRNWMDKSLKPQ